MNADSAQINTDQMLSEEELNTITRRVIGCAYHVSSTLGIGFLERVYENALAHELRKAELDFVQQQPVAVHYDGVVVGDYVPDLIVKNEIVLELKAAEAIDASHIAQCLNALRATSRRVGLVLNFGTPQLGVKRVVNNL
ncbi:MAG: GxxExxY protein [Phycisphaeraceae bacterium]